MHIQTEEKAEYSISIVFLRNFDAQICMYLTNECINELNISCYNTLINTSQSVESPTQAETLTSFKLS